MAVMVVRHYPHIKSSRQTKKGDRARSLINKLLELIEQG